MNETRGESIIRRVSRKIRGLARYYALRARGLQWLFVLGHMRSGSSLLVHLLNSSEEILGYGETHLDYVGRESLAQLHDHVRAEFEKHGETPRTSHRYVMDKILWPHVQDEGLFRRSALKVIVIVRNPKEGLPSILSLDLDRIQTPKDALQYYMNTLERIERNLDTYDSSFVLVRYEDLTGQTERTLQKISAYLGLGEPLKPEYDTMWATGEQGIGDPSKTIRAGTIVANQTDYEVDVGDDVLLRAERKHQQFLATCRAAAQCVCV